MPDISSDGMTVVYWVTTLSSTTSPTAAQINAGVALHDYITPDGFSFSTSTDTVDNTALSSTQNSALVGRRNDDISITFKDQGRSAAPWTTFAGTPTGWLVVRRGTAVGTAVAASQKVSVYPCQAGYRQEEPPAANELQKFTVNFVISGTVVDTATVA